MLIQGDVTPGGLLLDAVVRLSGSTLEFKGPFRAQIDTGASISVVTNEVYVQSSLPFLGRANVRTVGGDRMMVMSRIELGLMGEAGPFFFDTLVPVGVSAPVSDPNHLPACDILIGMNAISSGILTVDGPARTFAFEIA